MQKSHSPQDCKATSLRSFEIRKSVFNRALPGSIQPATRRRAHSFRPAAASPHPALCAYPSGLLLPFISLCKHYFYYIIIVKQKLDSVK